LGSGQQIDSIFQRFVWQRHNRKHDTVSDRSSLLNRLRLAQEIEDHVMVGVAWFADLDASSENPRWEEMETLAGTLRRTHTGKAPSEIDGLNPARKLYRAFGVDPTRTRPSSEALLRRVLKGQDLYRINRLVDAINWASLALLLPIGLYDLDRLEGDVDIRRGRPGEEYEGIRKGAVHVEGRLTVADALGPFGSPTSDSARTSIRSDTTRAVALVFAPGDYSRLAMEEGLRRLSAQVTLWCGGTEDGAWVLGGGASS
jgi:DNA/RNA-binding domain of Phe-tRNA-synthetase-like protein